MTKEYCLGLFILLIMILNFTGCSGIKNNNQEYSINDKVVSETDYLENEIFTLINKYTKNEYMEDDKINWEDVNKDAQKIGNILDTIILDFTEINFSNDELNRFRNEINNLLIACSKEDEYTLFKSASNLYSLIPEYFDKFSNDKNKKDIANLKSLVLKSYTSAYFLEWDDAKANAKSAEDKYKEMSDNLEYMKEYSYNLNKVYVLIEEYRNAVNLEELELSKIKYINFIEKS